MEIVLGIIYVAVATTVLTINHMTSSNCPTNIVDETIIEEDV